MSESEKKPLFIPKEWSDAASSVSCSGSLQPAVALVCGPKDSGKTTFSRNLVKVLLQRYKRVAYLDIDVGQPEFTVPGFLSLTVVDKSILDQDWTAPCLKTPERYYFYGDDSAKRDPKAYLQFVYTLFDYYQLHFCKSSENNKTALPLVINTPGWVKGLGYHVLVDVLRYVSPSHVVKINIEIHKKNLPAGLFWLDGYHDERPHLIEIQSAYPVSYYRSAAEKHARRLMRDRRIIAYFKQCIKGKEVDTTKELSQELASLVPYEVPISSLTITHLHCQIPSSEVFYSLNASIVGLGISSEVFEDLPLCVGLGIVRGIDTERGILYVITPVAENVVEKVDLLWQGYIEIPTSLLGVKDYRSPYLSPYVLAST
ncbi:Polynucleotide 5'-hydroxyl-kinase NOL9 [Raphanus sativus]|uniref:Polynucleotide 5'-hydroxyl-kinase NOL9 n=1 Tax=Raphanus sativus TaxID=3726 RepID=A0A6J0KF64_RAPSA|nr:polynucleotide 5'-hydroxyl-kinase NOL9 [Raphanus sativus]XP_056846939.1 polynucleotide 5'-hydroxyl-kinase NOL9 [Raphanus sativus]KAJ4883053.1 Polynucleotide 5'-hydroxyl-kinase NOL9 [Raphanus sativus]